MFDDTWVRYLGLAQDVPNDQKRKITLVGQPFTLSRTPTNMAARPSEFGEHSAEVLEKFGFGPRKFLRRSRTIWSKICLQPSRNATMITIT